MSNGRSPAESAAGANPVPASPVDLLRRWEEFGATWRVVARGERSVTVSLCRCDGGEEVQRLVSEDPDLLALVAGADG